MNLPWSIWIPTGALVISTGAFVALLWLSWDRAPEGQHWHAGYGWAASWAVVAVIVSLFLTVLGGWWAVRPWG